MQKCCSPDDMGRIQIQNQMELKVCVLSVYHYDAPPNPFPSIHVIHLKMFPHLMATIASFFPQGPTGIYSVRNTISTVRVQGDESVTNILKYINNLCQ